MFNRKSKRKPQRRATPGTIGNSAAPQTLHKNLQFTAIEQYKLLRANLAFMLTEQTGGCTVIGVTSSMRGEGKSTTSVNTSYVLAESGKRTLLIDCDLRIPSIGKKMEIDRVLGLTDILMGMPFMAEDNRSGVLDNWYVLTAGSLPPNPSELLGSAKMQALINALSKQFDYIVLDLPPVNIVSDALAVSKCITGMLLVVREDYTEKRELEQCIRQLKLSNVRVLGCVLNGAKENKSGYGKYKRYSKYYKGYGYGYGYGYGGRTEK